MEATKTPPRFVDLGLSATVLKGLEKVGYESPSPIQASTIPIILSGKDIVGQAQTGTGKTAAFALPILSTIDLKKKDPQVLVLTPTRELAIQVSEAFKTYASQLNNFQVLPVYGGQDYRSQIRALERGVHVAVGTPGRVMDHIRRGTLKLHGASHLVLDEADEMLRMGFIEDVEWILEQIPESRQTSLFSATMPQQIRRIATTYLKDPEQVTIKVKTATADTIRQRFWPVSGPHKLDTLTRILEAETFDAMLVFVRTRSQTVELAEKLEARGYAAAALNGDIVQNQRERTIKQLKAAQLDILVATDVAARGLDVERISHVINYDVPYDTEAYIHRIGRTGRAGRQGDAILFIAPREKRMLGTIEKATRQRIARMELPSNDIINARRIRRFKERIAETLESEDIDLFVKLVEEHQQETGVPMQNIAAALAQLFQGSAPFLLTKKEALKENRDWDKKPKGKKNDRKDPGNKNSARKFDKNSDRNSARRSARKPNKSTHSQDPGMQRFRIEVGHNHEVKPTNIVGAIANEAGIESKHIGRIDIFDDHSIVDLPEGMPKAIFEKLKGVWVVGQKLQIREMTGKPDKIDRSDAKNHPKPAGKRKQTDNKNKSRKPKTTNKKPTKAKIEK